MADGLHNDRARGRRLWWEILAPLLAGLALRLWWVWHLGQTTVDTRLYGEFAKNMLQWHVYGFSNVVKGISVTPTPTLIRLPGYPLFLALCFKIFGVENYIAIMLVQVAIDLWTCLLLGGLARRLFGGRAGKTALWLAALCPFTANYVAAPLTETLTLFCIAAAFYALIRWKEMSVGTSVEAWGFSPRNEAEKDRGFSHGPSSTRPYRWLLVIGLALAYAILLRPEQGLLAACVVPAMIYIGRVKAWRSVLLVCVLTLLPLVPWTVRNWHVFHVFEPLAPRYATDPGDRINYGFQRWYRTWAIEFTSTENTYWNYDGSPVQIADLPNRAFDSNAEYAAVEALYNEYNETDNPTYSLDARFNAIALERIHADPLRYYVVLPVARVANMILRPRTEMLPVPLEWWKFREHEGADAFALAYAALNLGFLVLAGFGLARGPRGPIVWAMVATIGLRTALLLTLDNSEVRYTLEFYPVLIVLASAAVVKLAKPVPLLVHVSDEPEAIASSVLPQRYRS